MAERGEGMTMGLPIKIDAVEPAMALEIPKGMSFDDWVALGRNLCASSQVINWYIGDWWAAGQHRYGARAKAAAEGLFGKDFGAIANIASVCRSFETSRRHEHLSFSHHQEVAALPPEEADHLLAKAEEAQLSTRELRKLVMSRRAPQQQRERDVIDVRPPEPPCIEFLTPDEIIVELAEALSRERALSDRESSYLERSLRKLSRGQRDEWDGEQDVALVRMMEEGEPVSEIAANILRTEDAVWSRVRYLRRKGMIVRRSQGPMAGAKVEE